MLFLHSVTLWLVVAALSLPPFALSTFFVPNPCHCPHTGLFHLKVFQWLHSQGCNFKRVTFSASGGRVFPGQNSAHYISVGAITLFFGSEPHFFFIHLFP